MAQKKRNILKKLITISKLKSITTANNNRNPMGGEFGKNFHEKTRKQLLDLIPDFELGQL